jgi:hypothetical protein
LADAVGRLLNFAVSRIGRTLRIWDRLLSREPLPEAGWVTLSGSQAHFVRNVDGVDGVRIWRFTDGDAVGIYFFPLVPDLPHARSQCEFATMYAEMVFAAGAKIVESELVNLAGVRALRTIIKSRQSPSGMTYVGSVTIPLANCSYVLKVQCEEHGITGLRETFLLDKKLREGGTVEAALEEIGRSADAPEHDALFPDHPLARARKHLGFIASALYVDPRLLSVTPFGLP